MQLFIMQFLLMLKNIILNFIIRIEQFLIKIGEILILCCDGIGEFFIKILDVLDCSIRTDVYVGVTGLLVAIVIFISEVISSKKNEIYKKLILNKTKIVQNVKLMMLVLLMIWLNNIFSKDDNLFLYIMFQLIINVLIVVSMIKTIKIFKLSIKLNTDEKYLSEELEKYSYDEIKKYIQSKNKSKRKCDLEKDVFDEYIEKSNLFKYEHNFIDFNDDYKVIYAEQSGFIKAYNYNLLNKVSNYLILQIKDYIDIGEDKVKKGKTNYPEIILTRNIEDEISRKTPIAYYKNVDSNFINDIKKSIIIDMNQKYKKDDVEKIISDLFEIAKEDKLNFDNNYRILNFYERLCVYKDDAVKEIFLENVQKLYFEANKENEYNKSYAKFLCGLSNIAFKHDCFEDFKSFNFYITQLYYYQMEEKNIDLKLLAYTYANHVFNWNLYSVKRKKSYNYYDIIMSNLLSIIKRFIKLDNIDAVKILFQNIHFETIEYSNNTEMNEYDILRFQFIIGIIAIMLCFNNKLSEDNLLKLKNLLENIRYEFFDFYDIWDVIYNFKEYSKKKTNIMKKIEDFKLNEDELQYYNSYVCTPMDLNEVLKCLLYIYKIDFCEFNNIKKEQINKDDKFEYERILNLLSSHTYNKIEKIFELDKYDISKVEEVLRKVIEIAQEHEEHYRMTAILNDEKKDKFKNIVLNKSKEKNGLFKVIDKLGKVKKSKEKLIKVFGINQLIPRDIFLDSVGGLEGIAENYGNAFPIGINKEVIKRIESYSEYTNESLENILQKIKNIEEYILVMTYHQFYILNYEKDENYLKINNFKIEVIKTNEVDDMIIINKKSLPEIIICGFDDKYNFNNVFDNMYYELKDCSTDEALINEIKKSQWIKEKGTDEEQINFIKQQCSLKIFMSYKIENPKDIDSKIIKEF